MKRNREKTKVLLVCLAALLSYCICGTPGYATTVGAERPPGEPPYGLAVHGDAAGTKLYGVLYIEYSNFSGTRFADARIVVRLRMSNRLEMFYAEAQAVEISSMSANQQYIMAAISPHVLRAFFPGQTSLAISVKNVSEFIQTDAIDNFNQRFCTHVMADIEVAVK